LPDTSLSLTPKPVVPLPIIPKSMTPTPDTSISVIPSRIISRPVTPVPDTSLSLTPKPVVPSPIIPRSLDIPSVIGYSPMYKTNSIKIFDNKIPSETTEPRLTYFPNVDDEVKRADASAIIHTYLQRLSRMRKQ
jgi:hypothetical protein